MSVMNKTSKIIVALATVLAMASTIPAQEVDGLEAKSDALYSAASKIGVSIRPEKC